MATDLQPSRITTLPVSSRRFQIRELRLEEHLTLARRRIRLL